MIYYFPPVHHKFFQFQLLKMLYIRIPNPGLKYENKTYCCVCWMHTQGFKICKKNSGVTLDNKQHLDIWDQQQW